MPPRKGKPSSARFICNKCGKLSRTLPEVKRHAQAKGAGHTSRVHTGPTRK